jgi:hypothetical protein
LRLLCHNLIDSTTSVLGAMHVQQLAVLPEKLQMPPALFVRPGARYQQLLRHPKIYLNRLDKPSWRVSL